MKLSFPTNLRQLQPSRRRVKVGDVFAYQMFENEFRYGRVVRNDAKLKGFPGLVILMLYFYRAPSLVKGEVPPLLVSDLLIPPQLTTNDAWLCGLFETVEHREIYDEDLLPTHCFREMIREPPRFYDEYRNELPHRIEPCGNYALTGFGIIDNKLSDALGVPQIPHSDKIKKPKRPRKPREMYKGPKKFKE